MDVIDVIRTYITQQILQREVRLADDAPLLGGGYLTSLQAVELVMFLGERFAIEILPDEVTEENSASLAAIARLVRSKLGQQRCVS